MALHIWPSWLRKDSTNPSNVEHFSVLSYSSYPIINLFVNSFVPLSYCALYYMLGVEEIAIEKGDSISTLTVQQRMWA